MLIGINIGVAASDVIRATGIEQTNVSFHLRALREAGLVRPERRGPFIYYCLHDPELLNIVASLNVWLGGSGRGKGARSRITGEARAAAPAPCLPGCAPRKTSIPKTKVAA